MNMTSNGWTVFRRECELTGTQSAFCPTRTRENRLPPADRRSGSYREAWRRFEAPPGASKLSPVRLRCVSGECPACLPRLSLAPIIGLACATEAPAGVKERTEALSQNGTPEVPPDTSRTRASRTAKVSSIQDARKRVRNAGLLWNRFRLTCWLASRRNENLAGGCQRAIRLAIGFAVAPFRSAWSSRENQACMRCTKVRQSIAPGANRRG